jgi:hypothetical protein
MAPDACPDCGSSFYRDGRCLVCAARRMFDQHEQMRQRSGPEYEKAVTRGRASYALWIQAGRPPRLSRVHVGARIRDDGTYDPGRPAVVLSASLRRGQIVEATSEQIAAADRYWQLLREQMPGMLAEREQKKASAPRLSSEGDQRAQPPNP